MEHEWPCILRNVKNVKNSTNVTNIISNPLKNSEPISKSGMIRCEEVVAKIHHPTIDTEENLKIGTGKLKFCNSLFKLSSTPRGATVEIGTSKAYNEISEWIKEGILVKYDEKSMGKAKGLLPLMCVMQDNKKKIRPVLDYRELNAHVKASTRDADVINDAMRDWRLMGTNSNDSVVDLKKAYLQIHVHTRHWPYQTVIYKDQRYALTRLGFGLNLAPVMMSSILRYVLQQNSSLAKSTRGYIDDTLATNGNGRMLVAHLKK